MRGERKKKKTIESEIGEIKCGYFVRVKGPDRRRQALVLTVYSVQYIRSECTHSV